MRKKDTGKSLSKIKPDNIQVFGSYVITDPKGELYRNSENCFSKRGNYMKRNLLSNSHFKLLFSNCDNIKNEKRTELYYSQNEIRLTNLDTGEVYSTKIRQEYSDERTNLFLCYKSISQRGELFDRVYLLNCLRCVTVSHLYKRLTYFYRYDRMEMITNECKKKT